jgi:hypothetical protein
VPYRSRSGDGTIERLVGEDCLKGGEQCVALLAQGCQIASETGEGVGSGVAAKVTGHFLVVVESAQVTLSSITKSVFAPGTG